MADAQERATYLQLADWRRRIAALYAQVRDRAVTDPVAAWSGWCAVREVLYRTHAQSPVPEAERADFRARHFPYDPALRFEATVLPIADEAEGADAAALDIPTSGGGAMGFQRLGWVVVPFPSGPQRLLLSWLTDSPGGSSSPSRTAPGARRPMAAGAISSTRRREPISAATRRAARSSSTSTSPITRPARSIPAGSARSCRPRIGSRSRSARGNGSPDPPTRPSGIH